MRNTAVAIPRRAYLNRTLVYRSSIWGCLLAFLLLAGFAALFSIGTVMMGRYLGGETGFKVAVFLICPVIVGGISAYLAARHLLRPLADIRVRVEQGRLQVQAYEAVQEIPFDQIADVRATCLPYVGGWITLELEDETSFTFSAMLERSEYIVDALALERPDLVKSPEIMAYRRTAIGVDHSWARLIDELQDWRRQFLIHICLPAGLALIVVGVLALMGESSAYFEKWLLVTGLLIPPAILIGAALWCVRDLYFLYKTHQQLVANPGALARNRGWEATVRLKFFRVQMALIALVAVALTVFFSLR